MGIEALKRFMLPAAVVVLVLVGLWMLLEVIDVAWALATAPDVLGGERWSPFGPFAALLVAVVIGVAALWGGRAAPTLVAVAIWLSAVGLLLQVGAAVIILTQTSSDQALPFLVLAGQELTVLVLPVLTLLWLLRLRRAVAGVRPPGQLTQSPESGGREPTVEADRAAGAHWQTASGAASGATANTWGRPGEQGGWTPPLPALEASPSASEGRAPEQPDDGGTRALETGPPHGSHPVHQPLDPQQFGPRALAEQFGRFDPEQLGRSNPEPTAPGGSEPTAAGGPDASAPGRRQPPQWIPLNRGEDS